MGLCINGYCCRMSFPPCIEGAGRDHSNNLVVTPIVLGKTRPPALTLIMEPPLLMPRTEPGIVILVVITIIAAPTIPPLYLDKVGISQFENIHRIFWSQRLFFIIYVPFHEMFPFFSFDTNSSLHQSYLLAGPSGISHRIQKHVNNSAISALYTQDNLTDEKHCSSQYRNTL